MDLELKGKRALVTGASSGLGRAIALELAAEGVSVAVHGRDRSRTEATVREVEKAGAGSVAVCGDLSRDDEAQAVAEAAVAALGGVDILVNSAGGVLQKNNPDWLAVSADQWLLSFNVNVCAAVRLSQMLAPAMVERGWGRIINISSVSGTHTQGVVHDYAAAKAALNSFTLNLSANLSPHGVTVNAVVPGAFRTPAIDKWLSKLGERLGLPESHESVERTFTNEFLRQSIPRLGQPREIALAVALIASPLSGYTTGTFFRIDGGVSRAVGA